MFFIILRLFFGLVDLIGITLLSYYACRSPDTDLPLILQD